jgi:hypothetical protein
MLESKIQKKIIADAKKRGYLALKIIRCNLTGFNDIVLFGKKCRTVIIECKAEGEKPDPIQVFRHDQLKALGYEVHGNIDTWEKYLAIGL